MSRTWSKLSIFFIEKIFFLDFLGFFIQTYWFKVGVMIVPIVFELNRFTGLFVGYKDNLIFEKTTTRGVNEHW